MSRAPMLRFVMAAACICSGSVGQTSTAAPATPTAAPKPPTAEEKKLKLKAAQDERRRQNSVQVQSTLRAVIVSQGACIGSHPHCSRAALARPLLVYHPRGGLGNAMLGMTSAAVLAMLLCRRFALSWGDRVNPQARAAFEDLFEHVPGIEFYSHKASEPTLAALSRALPAGAVPPQPVLEKTERVKELSTPCAIELTQNSANATVTGLLKHTIHCPVLAVAGNQYFAPMALQWARERGAEVAEALLASGIVGCSSSKRPMYSMPFHRPFFGPMSRRLFVPRPSRMSRVDEYMASLRADGASDARTTSKGTAIIGVHVRSVLLETVNSKMHNAIHSGRLLEDSGFITCIASVRSAAREAGYAASKIYLASDVKTFHPVLQKKFGNSSVVKTPEFVVYVEEGRRRMTSPRGSLTIGGALDELLLLARTDAIVAWDLQLSSYSAVAASWATHRAGGQAGERTRPWLGVHAVASGCSRIADNEVEPPGMLIRLASEAAVEQGTT